MASALKILDHNDAHTFQQPGKRINDVQDVAHFLQTQAYAEIVTFLFQLNVSVFPRHDSTNSNGDHDNDAENSRRRIRRWENGSIEGDLPEHIRRLQALIHRLNAMIDEAPPDTGPRRFGNISFRKWYGLVEERASTLLAEHLPSKIFSYDDHTQDGHVRARDEVAAYFIASFGSAQRLDYGTGHELNFLTFLATIWKLGGFRLRSDPGKEERALVLGVIEPYLHLVRRLIKTYTLEPAGSHGVWGLDDYSFLPYIFGSAQLCPAIESVQDRLPSEGSVDDAPAPADVVKPDIVARQRRRNMYFDAIGFITDVKRGPFWEHSPMLYDISGIRAGWAKINKGMLRMYNAEVLSKFPVVQHFPFGSLFSWDLLPDTEASKEVPTGRVGNVDDAGGTQMTTTTTTPQEVMQQQLSSLPSLNPASTVLPSSSVSATDVSTSLHQPSSSSNSSSASLEVLRPVPFSHVVHSSASVQPTSTTPHPFHPPPLTPHWGGTYPNPTTTTATTTITPPTTTANTVTPTTPTTTTTIHTTTTNTTIPTTTTTTIIVPITSTATTTINLPPPTEPSLHQ